MKKELFTELLFKLSDAFRVEMPNEKSLKVYWEYIKHIPDAEFEKTCDEIIKTERFFPAISTFLKLNITKSWPDWF